MTIKKRVFAALLALSVLLLCTACAGAGAGDQTTVAPATTAVPVGGGSSTTDGQSDGQGGAQSDGTQGDSTVPDTTAPDSNGATRISFLAAGDNIGHTAVYTDAKNRATDTSLEYNFVPIYNDISAMIGNADISFINQETIMGGASVSGGSYYGYPDFNSPQDMGKALSELGFDVVNIANNHMLDWGAKGLSKTIEFWKTQPVMLLGGYTDNADYGNIRVFEEQGVRIAFLSYTELVNYSHQNDAAGSSLVVPYPDDATIRTQVAAAKSAADLVFVSIHWGEENSFEPTSTQKRLTELFADCGVDAVIGHHPHVVQQVEWVSRNDGGKMLVAYSLGNLLSTMLYGKNMVGGLMTFDIVRENGGTPYLDNAVFVPTVTHYNMDRRGLQIYLLENYSEALAASHGCHADDATFTYAVAKQYITDHISSEFLPEYLK